MKIYTVYDTGVEAYLQPFFALAKGHAIRMFTDLVNDSSSMVSKYPDQYTLFELGTFDEKSATFNLHMTPVSIGVGIEFKRNEKTN